MKRKKVKSFFSVLLITMTVTAMTQTALASPSNYHHLGAIKDIDTGREKVPGGPTTIVDATFDFYVESPDNGNTLYFTEDSTWTVTVSDPSAYTPWEYSTPGGPGIPSTTGIASYIGVVQFSKTMEHYLDLKMEGDYIDKNAYQYEVPFISGQPMKIITPGLLEHIVANAPGYLSFTIVDDYGRGAAPTYFYWYFDNVTIDDFHVGDATVTVTQAATEAGEEVSPAAEEIAATQNDQTTETFVTLAGTYTVEKGDCLFKIAEKAYGDGKLWRKIYEANKDKIKNSKDYIIYAGQNFVIPALQ